MRVDGSPAHPQSPARPRVLRVISANRPGGLSGLDRDREEHGMPLRLVAIGDSTVEGVEDPGPDGVYIGWADRFAAHLDVMYPGLL